MNWDETPYIFANGERIWVIRPSAAAAHLPQMLARFRTGENGPFIIGAGQPEGAFISWPLWERLSLLSAETLEFQHLYDIARRRLADNKPPIPYEQIAAEFGWDLNDPTDDSEFKPR